MRDTSEQDAIDSVIRRFFAVFDNRGARKPVALEVTELFAHRAVIARHHGGHCEFHTPVEFAAPRVALLGSPQMVDFHEWEESSSTEVVGGIATRSSRYAKSGRANGAAYSGRGTKFFQLARLETGWRIVALSWIDDEPPAA
jgi:hypothetical protein